MLIYYLIYFLHIIFVCSATNCNTQTKYGEINGVLKSTRNNKSFCSFTGIPYAKPPIGDRRFTQSVKPDAWQNLFNATTESNDCIQINYFVLGSPIRGHEDCLYLNVYTKDVFANLSLPVMVYIHGGMFFSGSGSQQQHGPKYFLDEEIVLVTFNYRLGIFGFLGDDEGNGNWGLKDQVLALKWVQENIEYFGGNRSKVTIFGQSAGGASVHYHILSKQSTGLFHQAISQSGTAINPWARAIPKFVMDTIKHFQVTFANCTSNVQSETWNCLKKTSAVNLLKSTLNFKTWNIKPYNTFLPIIEPPSENAFIYQDIYYILEKEIIPNKVPWIIGNVENEGCFQISAILTNDFIPRIMENFDTYVPREDFELKFSTNIENIETLWTLIKNHYGFETGIINIETLKKYSLAYGDRFFVYPTYQSLNLHRKKNHTNIYLYKFTYMNQDKISYGRFFSKLNNTLVIKNETILEAMNVCHNDDLLYLSI